MFDLVVTQHVATLVMNRSPVNAMSSNWVAQFHAILEELETRDDWSVLHLRSLLPVFSAGADLKEMRERFTMPTGVDEMVQAIRDYQALFARIEALPRVTLAEIGGAALGGGLELTLACDLRIAAHEAQLGLPELRLGLLPGAGGTQRMTRLAGRPTALRLILGAEVIGGDQAERVGLVQWSVQMAELAAAAAAIARRYAELPAHAAAAAKACIAMAFDPVADGFYAEVEHSRTLQHSPMTRELVECFLRRGRS